MGLSVTVLHCGLQCFSVIVIDLYYFFLSKCFQISLNVFDFCILFQLFVLVYINNNILLVQQVFTFAFYCHNLSLSLKIDYLIGQRQIATFCTSINIWHFGTLPPQSIGQLHDRNFNTPIEKKI